MTLPPPLPNPRAIEINGHTGAVTDSANPGPTLVLLPSMLVLARSYTWLTRVLTPRYRVVLVEMPGCGHGSVLSPAWSFDQYADWLAMLLERLNLPSPTLIAHSNSGPPALILAASRPELIARLVIVDTIGADRSTSLLRVLAGRALDALIETRLTFWGFHHILYNVLRHWRNFWNQVRLAVRHDVTPAARRVTVPTLIAWGRRDHTMPLRGAKRLHAVMPPSTLHVFPTGSHDWLITNPDAFAAALDGFTNQP